MLKNIILFILIICANCIKLKNTKIEINSHFISIETNNYSNSYNILLTLSLKTNETTQILCKYKLAEDSYENEAIFQDIFFFSNQTHYFYKFENLTDYQLYEYNCIDIFSSEIIFNKNIIYPKNEKETNLLAFGDWSISKEGNQSLAILENLIKYNDAVLFLGDLAYNLQDEYGEVGNTFLQWAKSITSNIPFQLSVGNHEDYNNFEHYYKRFNIPNRTINKTFYYSYDINDIHLVSLNSEVIFNSFFDMEYTINMLNWLSQDLKKLSKWKIVYMHRPIYCSQNEDDCIKKSEELRQIFEDIFYTNKVDLVITGHRHNYERLLPVYNYTVDFDSLNDNRNIYLKPKYPVYVICGSTGNSEEMEKEKYYPRYYSQIVANTVGICYLSIKNDRLKFNHVLSDTMTIFDEFTIIKEFSKQMIYLNLNLSSNNILFIILTIVVCLLLIYILWNIFKQYKRLSLEDREEYSLAGLTA